MSKTLTQNLPLKVASHAGSSRNTRNLRVNSGEHFCGLCAFTWNQRVRNCHDEAEHLAYNQQVDLAPRFSCIATRYKPTPGRFPVVLASVWFRRSSRSTAVRIVRPTQFQAVCVALYEVAGTAWRPPLTTVSCSSTLSPIESKSGFSAIQWNQLFPKAKLLTHGPDSCESEPGSPPLVLESRLPTAPPGLPA